ncbi:MAG: acyl-CoA dehydrogenase family protein [Actinomycetota bacterium]
MTSGPSSALVDEVESWLRSNLSDEWIEAVDRDDKLALRAARERLDEADWWRRLGNAGWYFSDWPVEYGGLGLDAVDAATVNRTLGAYKIPRTENPLGINVAEALLRWGTDDQRTRFLPAIARQEEIWVQLFSEPGAGSDLAGLSTRAVRDGDAWIVNGQKVWSSHAERSTWGILLARTDPDVTKHHGLSLFIIAMEQPGIDVRPLRQMTGEAFFNEVFMTDAVVREEHRIGELGDGWRLASQLLTFERGAGSGAGSSKPSMGIGRSVDALRTRYSPVADSVLRDRLTQAYIADRVSGWTGARAAALRKAGRSSARPSIVLKALRSETLQRLQELSLDLEGISAIALDAGDRWADTSAYGFLRTRSATISGGSSQIQRNIIGEKVLGLPREPAVDIGVPWSEVARS